MIGKNVTTEFSALNPPMWEDDDFSILFRHRYIEFFPELTLFIVSVSFLLISGLPKHCWIGLKGKLSKNAVASTRPLLHGDSGSTTYGAVSTGVNNNADCEEEEFKPGNLSDVYIDCQPKLSDRAKVALEGTCLLCKVFLHLAALWLPSVNKEWEKDSNSIDNASFSLIFWLYAFSLFCIRLGLLNSFNALPGYLWYHFPVIYTLSFISSVISLRSSVIHPVAESSKNYYLCEFILNCALLYAFGSNEKSGNSPPLIYKPRNSGRTPAPEPVSSPFSLISFTYILPLLNLGYKKSLREEDVWEVPLQESSVYVNKKFETTSKENESLFWKFIKQILPALIACVIVDGIGSILLLIPSLLVRHILEYIDNPENSHSKGMVWLFAFGILICICSESLLYNHANFLAQRATVRLRALLMTQIYKKALKRRISDSASDKGQDENENENEDGDEEEEEEGEGEETTLSPHASTGTIINLMSIDTFNIAETITDLPRLAGCFSQIITGVYFLYLALGTAGLLGIAGMIILAPISYVIGKKFNKLENEILEITDKRVEKSNELFQGIRILKFFGWENKFADNIRNIRNKELQKQREQYILESVAEGVYVATPMLMTILTFGWFTLVQGYKLTSPVAFSALIVFNIISDPLNQLVGIFSDMIRSAVSVKRISSFINQPESSKSSQLSDSWCSRGPNSPYIGFEQNASFSWYHYTPSMLEDVTDGFELMNLNIDFPYGKLTAIAGPTGSGKTSLLLALLGEMNLVHGKVFLPGGNEDREKVKIDNTTGLAETVAYCPQQPWLASDTIRSNILFASPFDEDRYNAVLEACELTRDIEILSDGDSTLVGERGITLSGGQKQRVSLARAVYSRSAILLLDDCLSAVDSHTASEIYDNCLTGEIAQNRTIILVSHNVSVATRDAHKLILMENGEVTAQGDPKELNDKGLINVTMKHKGRKKKEDTAASTTSSAVTSQNSGNSSSSSIADAEEEEAVGKFSDKKAPNVNEEEMASGSVKLGVYIKYVKSIGPYWIGIIALLILCIQEGGDILGNWWIREWAEKKGPLETNELSDEQGNTIYYLSIYFAIGLANVFIVTFRYISFFVGGVKASKVLFNDMLQSVLRAKMRFYDSTPVGRIMNRFSKDIESIDNTIPYQIAIFGELLFICIATIAVVTFITPAFLIPGIFITMAYWAMFSYYLQSSRELKRMESVTRSPIYQQFGESLSGTAVIRAYGDQERFTRDIMEKIDNTDRPFFYMWLSNIWLTFWVDIFGGLVSFSTAAFAILSTGKIDSGLAGLSLSYATLFGYRLFMVLDIYSKLQMEMNSVERVKEYTDIDSEAPLVIEENRPPLNWPQKGEVRFENVNLRYSPDLPLVIKDLSLKIDPGSKIGVVGRTGAGKSTLITSLFRFLEVESGKITIDGIDISTIGLHDLRKNLAIIPQDPTLFTGTVRSNLDPFGLYTDIDVLQSLKRVHLIEQEEEGSSNDNKFNNLETRVFEGGGNLSQGQRQLLCLARSLLMRPKVLLLDEATASIDYETDSKIQRTIREEFSDTTLITVAHRIWSIADYDRILVMEEGQGIEYDHPYQLLQGDTEFRNICIDTGEFEKLETIAEDAFRSDRP